jgi:hypothetical protein
MNVLRREMKPDGFLANDRPFSLPFERGQLQPQCQVLDSEGLVPAAPAVEQTENRHRMRVTCARLFSRKANLSASMHFWAKGRYLPQYDGPE